MSRNASPSGHSNASSKGSAGSRGSNVSTPSKKSDGSYYEIIYEGKEEFREKYYALSIDEFAIACIPQTQFQKKDAEGKPIEDLFLMHWSLRAVYTGIVAQVKGKVTETEKSCVVFDTYKFEHPKKQGAYIFKVCVTPTNEIFSPKAMKECRFEAKVLTGRDREIVKVGDVVNLIRDEKLHQYVPDEYGSGCLKWTKTVLDHIVAKGWVAKNTATKFDRHVKTLQTVHKEEYWVPDDNGTFEK